MELKFREWNNYADLKDCNERKMYEGDIVLCNDLIREFKFLCEVKFLDGRFIATNDLLEEKISLSKKSLAGHVINFKIIGNIYENPEMLEKIRKPKVLEG
ncbi:YopX family protein [Clostridioides sp. ES-S-0010-02]|uniref:YopX family protein n=1 Tax=Clostridioides sp. ES-S-0010-02 TaxID=2770776 RepID=UPI001D119AA2|nr:hypothetical protein JJC01_10800 [Clostridioides sp. ES-S-0010-02]